MGCVPSLFWSSFRIKLQDHFFCLRRQKKTPGLPTGRKIHSQLAGEEGHRNRPECLFSIGFISISDNSMVFLVAGLRPARWQAGGQDHFLSAQTKNVLRRQKNVWVVQTKK